MLPHDAVGLSGIGLLTATPSAVVAHMPPRAVPRGGAPAATAATASSSSHHHRRLACVAAHVCYSDYYPTNSLSPPPPVMTQQQHHQLSSPGTAASGGGSGAAVLNASQKQHLREFVTRGMTIVGPEEHGLPSGIHQKIWEKLKTKGVAELDPYYDQQKGVPELMDVITSPGMVAALGAIMGKDWAVVPFIHSHFGGAGNRDQHWHKDDNAHYNARKMRHHRPVQLEVFYYPQEVTIDNGPTFVVPYSQYWTTNHEDSTDNFSGPDHLDFDFAFSDRMENHPDLKARDDRLTDAVLGLQWPLVQPERVIVPAGSAVLASHNIYHRASRQNYSEQERLARPRYMWRVWVYRTTEPEPAAADVTLSDLRGGGERWSGLDTLSGVDLALQTPPDAAVVWDTIMCYTAGLPAPPSLEQAGLEVSDLLSKLRAPGVSAEPTRLAAGYRLARLPSTPLAAVALIDGLLDDRESVRRAATYGIAAMGASGRGTALVPRLCELLVSCAAKSVRKHAAFVLGEVAPLTAPVLTALKSCLECEPSVFVRTNAAGALGLLGSRAIANVRTAGEADVKLLAAVFAALVQCLHRERNRIDQALRQGRSLKLCKVDDFSDLCEGHGIGAPRNTADALQARLKPVRSGVRENALWAMVILCTSTRGAHAAMSASACGVIEALVAVIDTDENICAVGFAMDALRRLGMHVPAAANAWKSCLRQTELRVPEVPVGCQSLVHDK